jgi:heme A synthase
MHPLLALVVGGLVLYAASYVNRVRPGLWSGRLSGALVALVLIQLLVGAFNVALLAPVWLQLVHLLLADFLWVALVLLTANALSAEAPAGEAFEPAAPLASTAETS